MRTPVTGIAALFVLFVVLIVGYSSVFTVVQTEQVLVVRLGEPIRVVTEPGLNFKAPFIDTVISIDKRILGGSEKLVYDGGSSSQQSIVPYLPLSELTPRRGPATTGQPQQPSGATR